MHITLLGSGTGNYDIPAMQGAMREWRNLSFETNMPGGMTVASCTLPWNVAQQKPRLVGPRLLVWDGSTNVWWGALGRAADTIQGGDRRIDLTAYGPWEMAAKRPFSQEYKAAASFTGEEIIKAALFGNLPDVSVCYDNWSTLDLALGTVSWSNSNVQTAIGDVLRLGDETTSPWSLIIMPPRPMPLPNCEAVVLFSSNMYGNGGVGNFAATGSCTLSRLYAQRDVRPGTIDGSTMFYATNGNPAYYARNVAAATSDAYTGGWFYLPIGEPAIEHELLGFYDTGSALNSLVYTDSTNQITAYNQVTATAYTGYGLVLGSGCWHHIMMRTKQDNAAGIIQVWLDGRLIISETGLNTGNNQINGHYAGLFVNRNANRYLFADSVFYHTAIPSPLYHRYQAESLPIAKLFTLSTASYDMTISLAEMGDAYAFVESLDRVVNQAAVSYSGGTTASTQDLTSISRYGQRWDVPSLQKTNSATIAGYYRDRYLAMYKEPRAVLQPFTLRRPPEGPYGVRMPLSHVRAGLRFRIRERPDVGNIYIGHTHYSCARPGAQEMVEVTPNEAPLNLAALVALRQQRLWT